MKTNLIKSLVATALLGASAQAFAFVNIRLDKIVGVTNSTGQPILEAFPEARNCKHWYYMSSSVHITGAFHHSAVPFSVRVENVDYPILYSYMETRAYPAYAAEDEMGLRKKIVAKIKEDVDCNKATFKPEEILLSSLRVKPKQIEGIAGKDAKVFESVESAFQDDAQTYYDPSAPLSITILNDATDPNGRSRWNDRIRDSQARPVEVGKLYYTLEGIGAAIDASMTVKGELNAKFESAVISKGCVTESGGSKAAGMLGGLFGGYGKSSKSERCVSELVSAFMGGGLDVQSALDQSNYNYKNSDGTDIMTESCKEAKCVPMPLEQYVKQELWTQFFALHFPVTIQKVTEETFKLVPGRNGLVNTTFNAKVQFKKSEYKNIGIPVSVYARALDASSLRLDVFGDNATACYGAHYREQVIAFPKLVGKYPLPLSTKCGN